MLLIDTVQGRIIGDEELKNQVALDKPYREWVERLNLRLADLKDPEPGDAATAPMSDERLAELERVFGMTQEDVDVILMPMAVKGAEPTGSWATMPRFLFSRRRTRTLR